MFFKFMNMFIVSFLYSLLGLRALSPFGQQGTRAEARSQKVDSLWASELPHFPSNPKRKLALKLIGQKCRGGG